MNAWIGDALLLLAGVAALAQVACGLRARDDAARRLAAPLALAHAALVALSFAALVVALVRLDWSIAYVAAHTGEGQPLALRIAAAWGGHEGSMLMWLLVQALWGAAVALGSRAWPAVRRARVLAVLGGVSLALVAFLALTSSPFVRLDPVPARGEGLNPLLQDIGMVLHPPVLYVGYVGLSVPFAMAVAALLEGRADAAWARSARPWTLVAWCALTAGIGLGSAWAYYELGWGGWWFWDPVENASLMPWLVATALLHSLAVTDLRRGAMAAWTVLLALAGFSLSLLGAFLVRSGVLSSVHAFAVDPARGAFVLVILAGVVGGSLTLYALRAARLAEAEAGAGGHGPLSRETLLLVNNLLLACAAASVALGTLYPLALDTLGLGRISVGAPYFEAVFVPLTAALVVALGVGTLARWRHTDARALAAPLLAMAGAVAVGAVVLAAWADALRMGPLLALAMALWIAAAVGRDAAGRGWRRLHRQPAAWWGQTVAHAGLAVAIVGMGLSGSLEQVRDLTLAPGEHAEVGGHRFTFHGVRPVAAPQYQAVQGLIVVERGGRVVAELLPEKRVYHGHRDATTEAAIDSGVRRDLFVALGEPIPGGRSWLVHLAVKPFLDWIWAGVALMVAGGLVAAGDRRLRAAAARRVTAGAVPAPAGAMAPPIDPTLPAAGVPPR